MSFRVRYNSLFFFFCFIIFFFFFFQAEDGIRDAQESRGLGDVYKRQILVSTHFTEPFKEPIEYGRYVARLANMLSDGVIIQRLKDLQLGRRSTPERIHKSVLKPTLNGCLLYTSDAADDLLCVDLGGRRNIKKKNKRNK